MKKQRFKVIPTVYLLLIKDNKILLSRRYNTGFHDGDYGLPSGHLKGNETLRKASIREGVEEIGIDVNLEDLELVHVVSRKQEDEERVNFFFLAKKWKGGPKNMEPDKCDDLRWFELDNLPNNIIPYIRQAIKSFSNNIFYSEWGW